MYTTEKAKSSTGKDISKIVTWVCRCAIYVPTLTAISATSSPRMWLPKRVNTLAAIRCPALNWKTLASRARLARTGKSDCFTTSLRARTHARTLITAHTPRRYMTGSSSYNPRRSAISLAFLQDTGWCGLRARARRACHCCTRRYKANFSNADSFEFGRSEGCKFAGPRCDQWKVGPISIPVPLHLPNGSTMCVCALLCTLFLFVLFEQGAYRCTPEQKGYWGCTCNCFPHLLRFTTWSVDRLQRGICNTAEYITPLPDWYQLFTNNVCCWRPCFLV